MEAQLEVLLFLALRYFGGFVVFLKITVQVSCSAKFVTSIGKPRHCQVEDKN